jgi:hypothetical protein
MQRSVNGSANYGAGSDPLMIKMFITWNVSEIGLNESCNYRIIPVRFGEWKNFFDFMKFLFD